MWSSVLLGPLRCLLQRWDMILIDSSREARLSSGMEAYTLILFHLLFIIQLVLFDVHVVPFFPVRVTVIVWSSGLRVRLCRISIIVCVPRVGVGVSGGSVICVSLSLSLTWAGTGTGTAGWNRTDMELME